MKAVVVFIVFILVASTVAVGQESRAEVFGGWQYMSLDTKGLLDRQNAPVGWDADLALKLNKNVGIVADFSGTYKDLGNISEATAGLVNTKAHVHNFLFGPRFSASAGKVTPFAEVLVGLARTTVKANVASLVSGSVSSDGLGFAVGGGIDVNASKHVSFRLVKADYMLNRINFSSGILDLTLKENLNHFRLASGIVFKF